MQAILRTTTLYMAQTFTPLAFLPGLAMELSRYHITRSLYWKLSMPSLTGKPRNPLQKKRRNSINRLKSVWALNSVSNPEMRIFVQGQGNQAVVRRRSWLRRTNKRAD